MGLALIQRKQSAFTIVELLIVIVVIAILAAISTVAYSGIQARAENTKTTNATAQYVKAIMSYATLNDTYPIEAGFQCLGGAPMCGNMTDTAGPCFGSGRTSAKAAFDSKITTVIESVPQLSTQQMNCGGKMYAGGYYLPSTGKTAQIIYFLKGDQSCDVLGGLASNTKNQSDDTTRCTATFPTLP